MPRLPPTVSSSEFDPGLARQMPKSMSRLPHQHCPLTTILILVPNPNLASTAISITFRKDISVTMADEERRTSKRSRFDQTEPEPKRASRFDRRSRSPSSRQPETRRSRSPLPSSKTMSPSLEGVKSPSDPAAAAGRSLDPLH